MKPLFYLFLFSVTGSLSFAQHNDTLDNKIIVYFTKMGLQSQTIITKIKTSPTSFDVSVEGLKNLNEGGVNGEVINEMIKISDQQIKSSTAEINSKNPNEMHRPGIYYFDDLNTVNPVRRVDPTITSNSKSGGFGTALAQSYSYGLAKDKLTSSLSGATSHLQIRSKNPVFYFYFSEETNKNSDNWFFATATSPNEFVCVKLKERKDSREMAVGSSNSYGASYGISNKIKIPFDYEEVSKGIYKVVFNKPLEKGEYCFLYASDTPTKFSNNKVFDFGNSAKKK